MILAIDVGNTNIVVGCIDNHKTYFVERLSTDWQKTDLEYAISFKNVIDIYDIDTNIIEGAIISSVLPPISKTIKHSVEKLLNGPVLTIGPGIKTGLNIKMDYPTQLGSDLVVDAVSALQEYEPPLIIIDMGTATTMSVVDKNKNYIGGIIYPGIKVSLSSLTSHAAQLPDISLDTPKGVIGKNTVDCMKSGAIFGNASMIDGMIDRIEGEIGMNTTIVATGGLAQFIIPYCKHKIIYNDDLLLKGLLTIYRKNI